MASYTPTQLLRRAQGLCVQCGAVREVSGSSYFCDLHKAAKAKANRRYNRRILQAGKCLKCKVPRGPEGTNTHCAKCRIGRQGGGPQALRRYTLKAKFGLSEQDYDNLFTRQRGRCLICRDHQDTLRKKLSVDHCHATNIVRGLLCTRCNSALGLFKENSDTMRRAILYLADPSSMKLILEEAA